MEFRDVVRRRRMVRRFDPDRPVPDEALRRCLESAVRAPSAGFSQGWDFVVLRSAAEREVFWASATTEDAPASAWLDGVRSATVLIVCCSDKHAYLDRYAAPDKGWTDRDEARWPVPYWDVDTGMASLLLLLTAVDEGLGALLFGVPAQAHEAVHEALGIPGGHRIVGVVALGHALPGPRSPSLRRHRRGVDEVTHWGRF
ncbi:MAG TPA: nitroreductase family protein [Intrasporangium sp.]|uniref:nitroreductase family protein n=1 Tax=Intrasporangium sp. TaxID=1925024 RepID=UPI002D767CE2|nr:nitroreductase family protein [Intrasporangium sp.]HET7399346.1 nitroreductase family protein [Intrasporangium sp.]